MNFQNGLKTTCLSDSNLSIRTNISWYYCIFFFGVVLLANWVFHDITFAHHAAHNSPIESIINTSNISSIKTKSIWLKTLCLCSITIMVNVKYCIVKSCKIISRLKLTEPMNEQKKLKRQNIPYIKVHG